MHPVYGDVEKFNEAMKEHNEQGENSRYVLTKTKYNGEEWPVLIEVVLGQYIHDLENPGTVPVVTETRAADSGIDRQEGSNDKHYESDQTGAFMFQHSITGT